MTKIPIDLKNTRQLILIAVALGLSVIYAYVSFLLLPQVNGAIKNYNKVNRIRVEVSSAEHDIAKIDGLKKQIEQYSGKVEKYEQMLPAEQEIPKLLEDLSTMAKGSGVKIVGITPIQSKEEPDPDAIYQAIPIQINAKSGYHELGKFLSELEASDRFMKVVDIKIRGNLPTPKKHDIDLLVLTYILLKGR